MANWNTKLKRLPHKKLRGDKNPIKDNEGAMGLWYGACVYCKRQYPEALLNIEGVLHHAESIRCVNIRGCRRAAKKLKGANDE